VTLKLLQNEVTDISARENFKRIESYLRDLPLLRGQFEFFNFILAAPSYPATVAFRHNLGFVPKDVITTSVIGGTVTWDYRSATKDTISASISALADVRCFIGTHSEGRTT
jgi:hypothetical protein